MKHVAYLLVSLVTGYVGAYFYQKLNPAPVIITQSEIQPKIVNYSGVNLSSEVNFVAASERSTASVVYIKTTSTQQLGYDWFDMLFFGHGNTQVIVSSGSGVIFSKDGYVLTNNHVIEKAEQIEVIHNKKSYKATLVGTDPSTDLAVLKIEADNLPAIAIGSSKNLFVGDWVLAVGNPFNLESTVTAGIVSAKGRNIGILKDRFPIESFIQTDAAINPGNSGGALVNLKGELVGINTAILSQTGQYAGYGFAVPIDIAKKIAEDIIKYGDVQKVFFGADVVEIDADVARKYSLRDVSGVLVTRVLSDAAADKVGIKKGDIIVEIEGEKIESKANFDEQLSYRRPGERIKVKFKRDDKLIESSMVLTNMDGTTELYKKEKVFYENLGAELETVTKIEKARLNIESGVKITRIRKSGLIPRMGIENGFIVTAINKKPINTPAEFYEMLERARGKVIIEGVTAEGVRGYYSFVF